MSTMPTSREVALRTRPPVPIYQGQEWWVDNPHRLAARLRTDIRAGRIDRRVIRFELRPGLHGAVVIRRRPRRHWATPTRYATISAGLLLAVAMTAGIIWAVWPGLALASLLFVLAWGWRLMKHATGHRATCAGLHCPGCHH